MDDQAGGKAGLVQATAATGFAARPRAVRADTAIGLPPGPEAGVFAQTVVLHRDPLGVLRRAQARHGDVFTLRLLTVRPLVIVSDPGLTSLLLEADPAKAHAGEARRRVLPFASPRSIFGADEAQHRAARHRVADVFTPEAMEGRRPRMAEIATRHVGSWPRGRPFRLLSRMRAVTDEIF